MIQNNMLPAVPSLQERIMSTRLSPHFTLAEMVRSGTAITRGIDNTPSPVVMNNLETLCRELLEPLRRRFGALRVTSGYRSHALNRAVGGAPGSQHITGEAADLHFSDPAVADKMCRFALDSLPFDQLIRYPHWIHISYSVTHPPRREFLHGSRL